MDETEDRDVAQVAANLRAIEVALARPTRRLKAFYIGEDQLWDVFLRAFRPAGGELRVLDIPPGIPADARVVGVCYDWGRRAFGVRLEHESFPEVDDGAMTPGVPWGDVRFRAVRVVDDSADVPVQVSAG